MLVVWPVHSVLVRMDRVFRCAAGGGGGERGERRGTESDVVGMVNPMILTFCLLKTKS